MHPVLACAGPDALDHVHTYQEQEDQDEPAIDSSIEIMQLRDQCRVTEERSPDGVGEEIRAKDLANHDARLDRKSVV